MLVILQVDEESDCLLTNDEHGFDMMPRNKIVLQTRHSKFGICFLCIGNYSQDFVT